MHFSSPRKENKSQGRSLTRNSSRSRPRHDDWKVNHNKKRDNFQTNKQDFNNKVSNSLPQLNNAKPRSVSSKSVYGSSTTSGGKSKCSKQTEKKNVSKSPVTFKKPKYQLVPKLTSNQSSSSSESVLNDDLKSKGSKDKYVIVKGQPRKVMSWIPKAK